METTTQAAQTPGQKVEDLVDTAKQEQAKTFTQAELDAIVQDRLDREKKKYADYKDLKTSAEKLKALEATKLSDEEKAKQKLLDLEKAISEKESLLAARDLKDKKRSALEAANLGLTEGWTLSDILDLMPGDEDTIPQEITKWQKRFPAKKGLGTGTQSGSQNLAAKTLGEQIADLQKQLQDSKTSQRDKTNISKQIIALSNQQLMQGDK